MSEQKNAPWKIVNPYAIVQHKDKTKVIAIQDDLGRTIVVTVPTMTSVEQHDHAMYILKCCNGYEAMEKAVEKQGKLLCDLGFRKGYVEREEAMEKALQDVQLELELLRECALRDNRPKTVKGVEARQAQVVAALAAGE